MIRRGTRRSGLAFGWALAVLAMALFAWLGFWQYGRMQEKQARLDAVAEVLREKRAFSLVSDIVPAPGELKWVEHAGRIEDATLLLDNQQRDGRPGVQVLCVFDAGGVRGGGHRLVDFGWVPVAGDRRMPAVSCPAGPFRARGLQMDPPSTGVAMGEAVQAIGPRRWLMTRVDPDAVAAATGFAVWPVVVRLDPTLPVGFERDLDVLPNTMPPERHLGYAVQWWALALAVFATALVLTFRSRKVRA